MICRRCHQERGEDFRPQRRICRPCDRARMRARYHARADSEKARHAQYRRDNLPSLVVRNRTYRAENPERVKTWQRRAKRKANGWEPGRFERMVEEQGGLCAVEGCGNLATDADHNHTTGQPRAPICSGCNKALGLLGEDPTRIEGLAAYLASWLSTIP